METKHITLGIVIALALGVLIWFGMGRGNDLLRTADNPSYTFVDPDTDENIVVSFDIRKQTATLFGMGYEGLVFTQGISASGARYVNEEEGLVLWNKGDDITLFRDDDVLFSGTEESSVLSADVRTLVSTTWVWQETQMNNDDIIVPRQAGAFTLLFDGDGALSASTDCNYVFGTYALGEDRSIEIGPLGSTKMYCEGSQETEFMDMLVNTDHILFTDAGDLVLLLKYDSGSVIFTREPVFNLGEYGYRCDDDTTFTMAPSSDMRSLLLTLPGNEAGPLRVLVQKTASDTGARYVNEEEAVVFHAHGETVALRVATAQSTCLPVEVPDEAPFNFGD